MSHNSFYNTEERTIKPHKCICGSNTFDVEYNWRDTQIFDCKLLCRTCKRSVKNTDETIDDAVIRWNRMIDSYVLNSKITNLYSTWEY